MACQEFTVLYTHQKTKKSKVWQDGILKSTVGGNKATLFDDKGQILDSIFVKFQVKSGDDLESERYLITVEAEKSSETGCSDLPKNTGGPVLPRNCFKSFSSSSLHLPAGLKRKHTGSQGPCRMKKKMAMEEPEIEVSSASKGLHSSFSSLLFSVPCKKEETNFLRNNDGDAFMKEHEDTESLSVLTVTPCTDKHKVVLSRNHNTDGADAEYIKPEFQLDNGMVKSNYCASSDETVSQNLRSKAQILALLNREQPVKASGEETIASLQNLSLPSIKSKFQLNGLPSRSTDSFLENKMTLVSQCANNTNKDSIRHRELPKTEKTMQAKSRWDAYLPLCLTEELSDVDDTEKNGTNASDLHPVKKDLKENSTVNRNQYREDNQQILQVSPSLESNIFPFNKSYVKNQLHGFIPSQSIVSKGNEIEVSSFASNPYLNCKNISKTLKDGIFKSSNCTIIGNLEEICQQSPNDSDPMVCSTHFSNNSAQGNLDLDNQFTEVNFNLLETCDFSDTEERELCVKNSVCFKEETETQLEDSVQKNCDTKASSEGKDNLQSAFLQDRDRTPISESQPVKLYDEILMGPNKMKKNCIKMLQHSDTTIVDSKIMENAVDAQNTGDNGNFVCTGRDLLIEKNVHCEMNDSKYHNQPTQLRKNNMIPYVPATLNGYFMDKINGSDMEVGTDNFQPSSLDICDNMRPINSLLASHEKYNSSHCFLQYTSGKQYPALDNNYSLNLKPSSHIHYESSNKSQMNKNELENVAGFLGSCYKSIEDKEKDCLCVNPSAVDSSQFSPLKNSFRLLESLTEHGTALESLEMIEENTDILLQRDRLREKPEATGHEAKQKFAEAPSSEVVQITSCLYSDSPTLTSCLSNDGETSTRAAVNMIQGHIPFEVVNKIQQKQVEFHGYQVKGSAASEIMMREHCSLLRWNSYASMAELEIAAEDACSFSDQELPSFIKPSECHFSPSPRNEEVVVDMEEQEFLMSRIVPDLSTDNETDLFRMEEPSCPKENDISMLLSTTRTQIPVVTAPVNEELSNLDYSSAKAIQQSFHFSEVNIYDMSEAIVPEDKMCETFTEEKCKGEREVLLTQYEFPNTSEQKQQSKWKKYQNTNHGDLRTQNSSEVSMTDNIRAENILAMSLDDTGGHSEAINKNPPDSAHLQMMKSMLCKQQRNFSSQDSVPEGKIPPLHFSRKCFTKEAPKITSELSFPSVEMVKHSNVLKRQICIPLEFQSPAHYKQIFTAALTEHLNILLYDLSLKLHKALGKVDITFCTSMEGGKEQENSAPLCNHKIAAKLLVVKKEGQHKGRLFYACDAPKSDRCDFFKWLEDVKPGQIAHRPKVVLHDMKSIGTYLRCQNIYLHEECQLLMRKTFDFQRKQFGKMGKFNISKVSLDCDSTGKLYLKLNRKEHSSFYNKDDIWVISKNLLFGPLDTFIACSVFFGPSSSNEVELVPLKGYSPSNWCSNTIVHALLVCNASTELTTLRNIEENIGSAGLPIMQHLLAKSFKSISYSNRIKKQKFKSPASNTNTEDSGVLSQESMINLANKMIQTFQLNKDQAKALIEIGAMMTSKEIDTEMGKQQATPIKIIHGVFGSGKSYLLAIVTLFLVQIFESSEAMNDKRSVPWKVLISSSTNVAVDRVLLCLLNLGFEEFIRVGSIRKIAKPILPFSLHAGSGPENEQLKELLALMKEDLTPTEKICVRKTIEHHKLGTNKALLQQVRVVGATCAACPFPCMKNLKFPIVVLDECSQMTEPASLLPIARFRCEKLILVGDPKQLPPTIQGSESAHDNGLEQTLFNRLCLMGHEPILLRTQYRCHPIISAISSELFYERNLLNGISELDRTPVVNWLPTLCFYNVNGFEQMERDNSFHNMAESCFIVNLIQSLITSGVEGSMIGVITLYKSQMSKISNLLGAVQSDISQIKAVQVSTVDAFQGAEKEIIVLSCVRTRQVGFIDSEKRVNVALTRGKRHLLIVGNLNCLRKNKLWGSVIQHCAGNKNGLQHVSECEQQLNDIIRSCLERKKEEEISTHREKSKSKSFLSKTKE